MVRTRTVTTVLPAWRRPTYGHDRVTLHWQQRLQQGLRGLWGVTLSLLIVGLWVPPATAAVLCRTISINHQPHSVCILKITRSAKQYWEYRASASVDGEKRPIESYDCRQRVRIRQNGKRVLIDKDPVGTLICQLFDR